MQEETKFTKTRESRQTFAIKLFAKETRRDSYFQLITPLFFKRKNLFFFNFQKFLSRKWDIVWKFYKRIFFCFKICQRLKTFFFRTTKKFLFVFDLFLEKKLHILWQILSKKKSLLWNFRKFLYDVPFPRHFH